MMEESGFIRDGAGTEEEFSPVFREKPSSGGIEEGSSLILPPVRDETGTCRRTAERNVDARQKKSGPPYGSPSMGEEKPDEELMGKRKSSPRFAASLDAAVYMMSREEQIIHGGQKFFSHGWKTRRCRFACAGVNLWYD